MTCIIGLVENGKVYMGGDSASSNDSFIQTLCSHKVFRVGPLLIGCAGSARIYHILRHNLIVDEPTKEVEKYITNHVVPKIRDLLKDQGVIQIDLGEESFSGAILIGCKGRLFTLYSDLSAEEYDSGLDTIGSGGQYALGALAVLDHLPPVDRIRRALEVACRFTPTVRGPFYVEVLE